MRILPPAPHFTLAAPSQSQYTFLTPATIVYSSLSVAGLADPPQFPHPLLIVHHRPMGQ